MPPQNKRIQVYPEPQTLRVLGAGLAGEGATNLNAALDTFADLLARATKATEGKFTGTEWNCIADANNGAYHHARMDARSSIAANVADGHSLEGLGAKWFKRDVDNSVNKLVEKINRLDHVGGIAVAWAVRMFWQRCQEIDHQKDEWWTLAFRIAERRPSNG